MSVRIIAVLAAASLALTACGSGDDKAAAKPETTTPAAAAANKAPLTITDPWVKTADKGMSAAFGTLVNTTGAEVTIASGTTPASPKVELHEVTGTGGNMKMRPMAGGFVLPPHGKLELKPGGFHIMLMDVTRPIRPGDQVTFTLTLKGGGTFAFTALGKAFKGGNEKYKPGH
ncbi:copper chaperone PCu(A)C [Spirillospora sp. CA-294931]|uniref:copper chaperone PCu(A)C n=1 Tax=Spirillospora sp. CA-294931 TaxID=3240042 RepID=UPI003D91BEB3